MKIVFTTSGDDINAPLDVRFGRAPRFLIYDLEDGTYRTVDNGENMGAAQGAGVQAAQNVAQMGVGAVVTGNCGPRAFQVLSAAGVKVFNCGSCTLAEALEDYRAGKLKAAGSANVGSHWT
jgi:predicted Fe-Mo cluster-binding NifX family protein